MDDFNKPGSPFSSVFDFALEGEKLGDPGKTGLTAESRAGANRMFREVIIHTAKSAEAVVVATGERMGPKSSVIYLNHTYGDLERVAGGDLKGKGAVVEKISAGDYFWKMKHPLKRIVSRIVFEPGAPEYVPGSDVFNVAPRLMKTMCEPNLNATASDIQPLIDHLEFISDGDTEGVAYVLNWLATLLQRPDLKIPAAIMLYSRHGGVGKSMLFELLSRVFGPPMVGQAPGAVFKGRFKGDILKDKRLLIINELSKADRGDDYEEFKSNISEASGFTEGKGDKAREVANPCHFIITTNNADCLPLMENDRRILVLRCEAKPMPSEYYQKLGAWMEGPGPSLLAGVLAQWQFPEGWDARAPVPQTKAVKQTQREARGGPLADFICELVERGNAPFERDFGNVSSLIEQLGAAYPTNARAFRLNNRTVPTALQVAGAVSVGPFDYRVGRMTRTARAWVWRNLEKWVTTGADGKPAASAALVDAFGEANK